MNKYIAPIFSILAVAAVAWLAKSLTRKKFKMPNGRKGSAISIQVAIAFAIFTMTALTTKDIVSAASVLMVILLLIKTKLDCKKQGQNHLIASAAIGTITSLVCWWMIDSKMNRDVDAMYQRPELEAPKQGMDMRQEADRDAPGLRIYDDHDKGGNDYRGGHIPSSDSHL